MDDWCFFPSQSKSPNVPKWVKMSLVFSWRVIIPALTQLLFQFEWTVTDIYCCWCWDEYESSFLIILESLKSHLHLRPKKKKRNKKFTQRVRRKPLPMSFRPQRILFQNFRFFFFSQNPYVRIFFYLLQGVTNEVLHCILTSYFNHTMDPAFIGLKGSK